MEWLILVGDVIILLGLAALALLTKHYLPSYAKEKGKNLATREDIEEITSKIESVKKQYAADLEGLKSQLNAKFHVHSVRYEKEFKAFEKIWKSLVELNQSTQDLPEIASVSTSSEERSQYLNAWKESYNKFLGTLEANRPFIPSNMYDSLKDFLVSSAKDYMVHLQIQPEHLTRDDYRGEIEQNVEMLTDDINETTEILFKAIQERLKDYEPLT